MTWCTIDMLFKPEWFSADGFDKLSHRVQSKQL